MADLMAGALDETFRLRAERVMAQAPTVPPKSEQHEAERPTSKTAGRKSKMVRITDLGSAKPDAPILLTHLH